MIARKARFALVLLATAVAPAFAEDLVVTRYDDPVPNGCLADDCSLREAVIEANTGSDPDRILLSAGTYVLSIPGTNEDAAATGDLDLKFQAELIGAGPTMTTIDGGSLDRVLQLSPLNNEITIRGVSIVHGNFTSGSGMSAGGGGDLVLDEVYVHDNSGAGPAVYIGSFVDAIIQNTTVAENAGPEFLGIQTQSIFFNSTISDSVGVLASISSDALVYFNHTTFRGGVGVQDSITVASSATLQLANSALIHIDCDVDGTVTSFGGNIEATGTSCGLDHASDQEGVVNHHFDVLGDNGGPTPTHMPATTSPAVNNGLDAFCHDRDQRGVARPATNCDVGAVERSATQPITPIFHDGFEQGNSGAWSSTVD